MLHPLWVKGLKFGEAKLMVHVLPCHLHRHAADHLVGRAVHHIAQNSWAFGKLNACGDIGDVSLKGLVKCPMEHGKGINDSFAAGVDPDRICAQTTGTDNRRRPTDKSAASAFLNPQFVCLAALPERPGIVVDMRERSCWNL